VLVSATVRDLVAGSGIAFAERGEYALKGLPHRVRLFAVEAASDDMALAWVPSDEPAPESVPVTKGPAILGPLSRRESEVAILVSQGMTSRQIAARLHLAERTIENHVQNALNKLSLNSRAQLAAWTARRTSEAS